MYDGFGFGFDCEIIRLLNMKKINCFLAIIFLFINYSFSNNIEEETSLSKGIKRKFILKEFNQNISIYLREDFSFTNCYFSKGCVGGYIINMVFGEYKIDGNHIAFIPKKMLRDEGFFLTDFTKKDIDTVDYYYSDSTKIQLNYWHIKKDSFEFLLSEAEFNEFDECFMKSSNFIALANLYNSNIEGEICYSVFCNIDTTINIRTILSKENIPEKFHKLFLDNPIEIDIKSVKLNKEHYPVYHLLSDKFDNAFIGMKFYYSQDDFYPPIVITEKKDGALTAMGTGYFFYKNFEENSGFIITVKQRSENGRFKRYRDKSKLKAGTIVKTEKW